MSVKKILVSLISEKKFNEVKEMQEKRTGIKYSNSDIVNFLIHYYLSKSKE